MYWNPTRVVTDVHWWCFVCFCFFELFGPQFAFIDQWVDSDSNPPTAMNVECSHQCFQSVELPSSSPTPSSSFPRWFFDVCLCLSNQPSVWLRVHIITENTDIKAGGCLKTEELWEGKSSWRTSQVLCDHIGSTCILVTKPELRDSACFLLSGSNWDLWVPLSS